MSEQYLSFLFCFLFNWTFITSIKPEAELYGAVTYWPKAIVWDSYKNLFTTTVNFLDAMKNSFVVAAATTIVSLTTSTLAAYAFFKISLRGKACDDGIIF